MPQRTRNLFKNYTENLHILKSTENRIMPFPKFPAARIFCGRRGIFLFQKICVGCGIYAGQFKNQTKNYLPPKSSSYEGIAGIAPKRLTHSPAARFAVLR